MKSLLLIATCLLTFAPAGAYANGDIAKPKIETPVIVLSADTIVTTEYVVVRVKKHELDEDRQVPTPAPSPQPPQIMLDWATPLDSNLLHYPFILKKQEKK